jgi:hypothetical protein
MFRYLKLMWARMMMWISVVNGPKCLGTNSRCVVGNFKRDIQSGTHKGALSAEAPGTC